MSRGVGPKRLADPSRVWSLSAGAALACAKRCRNVGAAVCLSTAASAGCCSKHPLALGLARCVDLKQFQRRCAVSGRQPFFYFFLLEFPLGSSILFPEVNITIDENPRLSLAAMGSGAVRTMKGLRHVSAANWVSAGELQSYFLSCLTRAQQAWVWATNWPAGWGSHNLRLLSTR